MKLQNKKEINGMIILFMMTYFVSYITRINYSTIISEMVNSTGLSKALLSTALTGSAITYGTGQVISGFCGDKLQPKKLILIGLLVISSMNILIPLCTNVAQMAVVWSINGFAQAFIWPPMVKLQVELFSDEDYNRSSVLVSWGASFGMIAMYLLSPVLIMFFGWKSVFVFSAVSGAVMAFIWNKKCHNIQISKQEKVHGGGTLKHILTPLMIAVMIAIVLQGALRDGVTTWMPSYISETYKTSSIISILTGVVMPVFSILCLNLASNVYTRIRRQPVLGGGIFFGVGAAAALLLSIFTDKNIGMSVFLSAVLTGCMHGVNFMLICMIPPYFKKYGNVSSVAGILNACTYIGSSTSTYGIAVISEEAGWNTTIITWLAIAAAGTLLCFLFVPAWNRFTKK